MTDAIAYFLTWHTYGTWLRGDPRGWIDRVDDHTELREQHDELNRQDRERLKHDPIILSPEMRSCIDTTIREVCGHRHWMLNALNVRSNHVHVIVSVVEDPDKTMTDLKAWATRRLREAGLVGADTQLWTKGGSTKHIHNDESLDGAINYVLYDQDKRTRRSRSGLEVGESSHQGAEL